MKQESRSQFVKVQGVSEVSVGVKLAWEPYNSEHSDDLYWATVTKVMPKSIMVDCPDATARKYHHMTFRMRSIYGTNGSVEVLEPYADATGTLYRLVVDAGQDTVQAAYDARAADIAAQQAAKDAKQREREEQAAQERAEALAANEGVTFAEFGILGDIRYFSANVINEHERMCMVVVAVRRQVDPYNWNLNDKGKKVWMGAVNYVELNPGSSTPGSMSSCSGTCNGITMEEMFQNVIAYVW